MSIRKSVLALFLVFTALVGVQARAADVPVITNTPLTVSTALGAPFSYTITASNSPTSFFASPLPAGLTISPTTGVISGAPAETGTFNVVLGATNSAGTGVATLALTVTATDTPVITNNPLFVGGVANTPMSFVLTSSGSDVTYSSGTLPAGLGLSGSTGAIVGTPLVAGTTQVPITVTDTSFRSSTTTLTFVIAPAGSPAPQYLPVPVIQSAATATVRAGTSFTYTILASNSPTSYSATGLPAGLTLNASTGVITGTPTAAGTYPVALTATNATGTAGALLTLTVTPAPVVAPVITNQSASATATAGTAFTTYQIAASNSPTSYTATGLPPGLTVNALTGAITGTPTTAGTYVATVTATNSAGSSSGQLTITVAPAPVAPTITSATSLTATAGQAFPSYTITASGLPTGFNATGLPAGLVVNPTTGAITGTPAVPGTYFVTLTAFNSIGTNSTTLALTVLGSRIVNFSVRALSGPGDQTLVVGFNVSGNGKKLLVRGVGPALTAFGVQNALTDPLLTVFNGTTAVATNDDWQVTAAGQPTAADISAAGTSVGAFALPPGGKDAALIATLNNGGYTTSLVRTNATTGVALTELYDLDLTNPARLVNVSTRTNVGTGDNTLIAGFVIAGNSPKTVLIRGIGPSLAAFGVTGVLADPQITVMNGSTVVATNDNWGVGSNTAAQITATSAQVGAFALAPGTKDAALVATLQPGSYTVQVSGVGNTTGVALIEVYDAQ